MRQPNSHYVITRISDGRIVARGSGTQCAQQLGICNTNFYCGAWRDIGGRDAYIVDQLPAPKRKLDGPRKVWIFTVFEAGTDNAIITGTAKECARALNITVGAFYNMCSRVATTEPKNRKFDFQREVRRYVE